MTSRLQEILTESKKTYPFKIGIVGAPKDIDVAQLETALQKFVVEKMSAGKKTPIQKRPLDFPALENTEVTYFDVELGYPTTAYGLQQYIKNCCGIEESHLIVRNQNEPQEEYQDKEYKKVYEPKLGSDIDNGESAQEDVGTNRTMNLLAELEKARKERDNDPGQGVKGNTEQKQMALNEPEESKSPVGSK